MDALVNRVTTIINQQNSFLEASLTAGTRAERPPGNDREGNMNRNNSTAPAVVGVASSEATETGINDPNNTLQLELSNWSSRVKFMVPIIVLVLVKILADHIVTGFVVILCTTSFYRLKTAFELELALKERSNSLNLMGLLVGSISLLGAILIEIKLLNYHDAIYDRLLFRFPDSNVSLNLLSVLWVCIVTDGIVQLGILACKILVVNSIGLYFKLQGSGLKCRAGRSIWQNGVQFSSLRQQDFTDIESGNSSESHSRTAASTFAATISSFGFSSIGSSIGQLVRRQTMPTVHAPQENRAHQQHSHHFQHRASSGISTEESVSTSDRTRDGQNSSDASVDSRESTDFLLKVRICGLIDIFGLVYRTALPMPYWALYFYHCPTIGIILRVLYVTMKFYDLSWKARGAAEAITHFATSKIEFGHYSTEEELNNREDGACECPVCFDNPQHAVTLDCHHIFCEVCILEWLEKEQTCPVCRAKVERSSPQVQVVKAEATYTFPILV